MKKQTFILEVNDSQNESWQRSVEWIQGEKKQPFRSVMELLRLVDSAVCGEEGHLAAGWDFAEGMDADV